MVNRLPHDSLTVALMRGGREWFGWDRHMHALADIYDAVNNGTVATGNWKDKPPTIPAYPRPTDAKSTRGGTTAPRPKSVKELYRMFPKP